MNYHLPFDQGLKRKDLLAKTDFLSFIQAGNGRLSEVTSLTKNNS